MTRALETIERNAHIQEQLIADILDVSRIVTGKLRLELRPIELAPVIEAALDAVRPAAAAKGIHLEADTELPGDRPGRSRSPAAGGLESRRRTRSSSRRPAAASAWPSRVGRAR